MELFCSKIVWGVCTYVIAYAHMHGCCKCSWIKLRGHRLTLEAFCVHATHHKLRQDLWLLDWLASLLQRFLSLPPVLWLQEDHHAYLAFTGDPNFGPHTCVASALHAEPRSLLTSIPLNNAWAFFLLPLDLSVILRLWSASYLLLSHSHPEMLSQIL